MKRIVWLLTGAALMAVLAACETTGNPREGGLFGWSETKAQARQEEKRGQVTAAEAELAREKARGEALQERNAKAEGDLAKARKQEAESIARVREQRVRLLTKTEELEAASPTAATASRARAYRAKVEEIASDDRLKPRDRTEQLYRLETEIDHALARSKQ
jgi:hypothetical protein